MKATRVWMGGLVLLAACSSDDGYKVPLVGVDADVPSPDVAAVDATVVDTAPAEVAGDAAQEVAAPDIPDLAGACQATPIESCDGEDGCFRWTLKGIEVPPNGDPARFVWQVEAHCAEPLDEVLFAFDPGIDRTAPTGTYTSPEGTTWSAAFEDSGCGGYRLTRTGPASADGKDTFTLLAVASSVEPTTVFENRARAGATTGVFATRASSCFVFVSR
ncbi:MAG: hypothetical protein U1F43_38980 [Myxococcota bacterium]